MKIEFQAFCTESILGSLSRMFFLLFLCFLTIKITKKINSNILLLFLIINIFVIIVLSGERTAFFYFVFVFLEFQLSKKYIYLIYSSLFISFIFITIFSNLPQIEYFWKLSSK